MKALLFVPLLTILLGCAAQKSPEEIAAEQEQRARYQKALASVKVSKEEPNGCEYIKAVQAEAMGLGMLAPASYDEALKVLQRKSVEASANFAVMDESKSELHGSTSWYIINARLFRCP